MSIQERLITDFASMFSKGVKDCEKGKQPIKKDSGYQEGYGFAYEKAEKATAMSRGL